MISLVDPSHVQSVVRNVLLILMDLSTDGSLPVADLRSAYRQMFNALVDVSRLSSDEFNGYIQVRYQTELITIKRPFFNFYIYIYILMLWIFTCMLK